MATVSSVSNGNTVIGPLMSSLPPLGRPADSASVIGPFTGHVKLSACARSFVRTSRAGGFTCSSTNVAVLGASVNRSTRISAKPWAKPWITGKRVRRAGGADEAAADPGDVDAAGGRDVLGVNSSTRSTTPRASRRAARSRPSMSTPATVSRRESTSASRISIFRREADANGCGRSTCTSPQPPSSSVPESEALRTSSASLSTSTFKTTPSRPPVGR